MLVGLKNKYFLAFFLAVLVLGLFFLEKKYYPVESLIEGPPPFLRLHILANSNEENDQTIKLKVRDLILVSLHHDFKDMNSSEEAISYAKNNLREITNMVNQYLKDHNLFYEARCSVVREDFKSSTYGIFELPEGEYWALRVNLGEGKGKNWWCVLYPPLCFYELNDGEAISVINQNQNHTKPEEKGSFFKNFYYDKILKVWITQ